MMYKVSRPSLPLKGHLRLDGSKSISNRVLILRALAGIDFPISGLSTSRDTSTLQKLLQQFQAGDFETPFDTGAAGTTFRFLTAFLSQRSGTQILTGSERMKQRPIGPLVDALRQLGAQIDYLEKEGYPPLRIHAPEEVLVSELRIAANTSSQYITALLLLGAFLPDGLRLRLLGKVVSRPYIEMTRRMLLYFGLESFWEDDLIVVPSQSLRKKSFNVEADWSAASYHYLMAALGQNSDLYLDGLSTDSLQGDAVIAKIMVHFGVQTEFTDSGIRLIKPGLEMGNKFEWDFLECPDLAQTIAVACGALGIEGQFTGLETLRIKETDRIAALQQELAKVGVGMKEQAGDLFTIHGQASWTEIPVFATYEDHRMAMAFAPLGMLKPVAIDDPMVVGKSYPGFWEDLTSLEFSIDPLS